MKRLFKNTIYTLTAMSVGLLAGCSYAPKNTITINPEAQILSPNIDNDIDLDVILNIPKGYISSRSMATIEPVLILGDEVVESFEPIVIQGKIYEKKERRLTKLHGYNPGYTSAPLRMNNSQYGLDIPVTENIHLSDDFDSGRIEAYVTTDGCGECYGVDTIQLAYISNLSNLIDTENLMVQWIDTILPAEVKSYSAEGQARIQFEVNKSEILMNLADNASEMGKMLESLRPVLKDSLSTLNAMSIKGSASAEGRYDKNVALAKDRANAAKEWINNKLKLTPRQRNLIKIGSQPEGWEPVIAAMHAAGDADSVEVKKIVEKYPDLKSGAAEKQIRKLKCWPKIANQYLAKDRRVIYKYDWTIKSFDTDDEVMAMYRKRPDALSESEFLRVSRLIEENYDDDQELIDLYKTLLKYKPNSQIGINNLAVLYYDNGMYQEVKDLLESQDELTDDMKTTLAVCYKETGNIEHAINLLEGIDTDKANYNIGTLLASTHRMGEAYQYLQNTTDLNTAITALGIGNNEEAWKLLGLIDDDSPRADYIRAITLVRLGDKEESINYLKNALKDPDLKNRAKNEADFIPLRNEFDFIDLINE